MIQGISEGLKVVIKRFSGMLQGNSTVSADVSEVLREVRSGFRRVIQGCFEMFRVYLGCYNRFLERFWGYRGFHMIPGIQS